MALEIREMLYIHEISHADTLSKAAENLYISQPALSKAVKRIEEKLGFAIYKKIGTRNRLTAQGVKLIESMDTVIEAYKAFESQLKIIQNTGSTINYGVLPYYCTPFTTMFLYTFKKKYPNIVVNLIEAPKDTLIRGLINGEIDVAMTETPLDSDKIAIFSGFQDDVAIAIGPQNALYEAESISFDALKECTFDFITNSPVLKSQLLEGCRAHGYDPKIGFQSSQISMLLENTKQTESICLLNRPIIYDNIMFNKSLEGLKILPLNPSPQCFCYVSYRKGYEISTSLHAFLDALTTDLTDDTAHRIL